MFTVEKETVPSAVTVCNLSHRPAPKCLSSLTPQLSAQVPDPASLGGPVPVGWEDWPPGNTVQGRGPEPGGTGGQVHSSRLLARWAFREVLPGPGRQQELGVGAAHVWLQQPLLNQTNHSPCRSPPSEWVPDKPETPRFKGTFLPQGRGG